MRYYRYAYGFFTDDRKLEFRQSPDYDSESERMMHVAAGPTLQAEPGALALLNTNGFIHMHIRPRERRTLINAAAKLLASAGYHLDTTCHMMIVWRTVDDMWQLYNEKGSWAIQTNSYQTDYKLPISHPPFRTRDAAVRWAQEQYDKKADRWGVDEEQLPTVTTFQRSDARAAFRKAA